jgi:hypothetical protein
MKGGDAAQGGDGNTTRHSAPSTHVQQRLGMSCEGVAQSTSDDGFARSSFQQGRHSTIL